MDSSYSIQIYNGPGVSKTCFEAWQREAFELLDNRFYTIEELSPNNYNHFDVKQTAVIIVPGGDTLSMLEGLQICSERIKTALAYHAGYLGSCAGAIAVSPAIVSLGYHKKLPQITSYGPCDSWSKETKLSINKAKTFCPYYTPAMSTDGITHLNNCTSVSVEWQDAPLLHTTQRISEVYHAFGPCFTLQDLPKNSGYAILARYITQGNISESKPAATIFHQSSERQGRLFTGVHPEIRLKALQSNSCQDEIGNKLCTQLMARLEPSEKDNQEMLCAWFKKLNLHVKGTLI